MGGEAYQNEPEVSNRVGPGILLSAIQPQQSLAVTAIGWDVGQPPYWVDDIERDLGRPGCAGVVATEPEAGRRVVGYLQVRRMARCNQIDHLVVSRHRERQGIGRRLMELAKSDLAAGVRPTLRTWADEYNLAGQLFLRAEGFRCYGQFRMRRGAALSPLLLKFAYELPVFEIRPRITWPVAIAGRSAA